MFYDDCKRTLKDFNVFNDHGIRELQVNFNKFLNKETRTYTEHDQ